MTVSELLSRLQTEPDTLAFAEVLAAIDEAYIYAPTTFTNGLGEHKLVNEACSNEGSCRVFDFARLQQLSPADTLACFAEHYRAVAADPHGSSHPNIRMFMRYGWTGIRFDGDALVPRG